MKNKKLPIGIGVSAILCFMLLTYHTVTIEEIVYHEVWKDTVTGETVMNRTITILVHDIYIWKKNTYSYLVSYEVERSSNASQIIQDTIDRTSGRILFHRGYYSLDDNITIDDGTEFIGDGVVFFLGENVSFRFTRGASARMVNVTIYSFPYHFAEHKIYSNTTLKYLVGNKLTIINCTVEKSNIKHSVVTDSEIKSSVLCSTMVNSTSIIGTEILTSFLVNVTAEKTEFKLSCIVNSKLVNSSVSNQSFVGNSRLLNTTCAPDTVLHNDRKGVK